MKAHFYILAFLEGFCLLGLELLTARLIAPHYGTSLYVWTTVIGVTLACLALGYQLGSSWASDARNPKAMLFYIFLTVAIWLGGLGSIDISILSWVRPLPLLIGAISATLMMLGPPMILLGTVSPLIIQQVSGFVKNSGKAAGQVFGISTFGGILSTFLLGFWIIPDFGISLPLLYLGALLITAAVLFLYTKSELISLLLFGFIFIYEIQMLTLQPSSGNGAKVLYSSEGLLGQLKVTSNDGMRSLSINGIIQTLVEEQEDYPSDWQYVYMMSLYSTLKPVASDALICGLGGGSLVKNLVSLRMHLDVVELDDRMQAVGEEYFGVDPASYQFHLDDVRHYLHTAKKEVRPHIV